MYTLYFFLSIGFISFTAVSAAQDTWLTQGSAFIDKERIVLTPDKPNQGGAAWSPNTVDLNKSFTLEFPIYLGENDGADGIAFVFTNLPKYNGGTGGTLGVEGVQPSVSVNIYTFSDSEDSSDQVTVRLNAPDDHPEVPLFRVGNLTDGQEHLLRISWTAPARLLRVYIGENLSRPRVLYFIPQDILENESRVHFGFTAATGDLHNLHYFVPSTP